MNFIKIINPKDQIGFLNKDKIIVFTEASKNNISKKFEVSLELENQIIIATFKTSKAASIFIDQLLSI
jgi:hypothetical protein